MTDLESVVRIYLDERIDSEGRLYEDDLRQVLTRHDITTVFEWFDSLDDFSAFCDSQFSEIRSAALGEDVYISDEPMVVANLLRSYHKF